MKKKIVYIINVFILVNDSWRIWEEVAWVHAWLIITFLKKWLCS